MSFKYPCWAQMRNSCMAIRAELLYAVPVCFTNSCYTLRLLFKFRGFFLNPASVCKTGFAYGVQRSDLPDQISVWGGRVHVAHAWLCPDEQEGDRSRNGAWRGSGAHPCSVMLQIQEMIPFLVKCREGGAGRGTEARQSLSSSEIRPQLVQHTFPTRTSCCNDVFMAPLEAAEALKCVSPLWSRSSNDFVEHVLLPRWPWCPPDPGALNLFSSTCYPEPVVCPEHLVSDAGKCVGNDRVGLSIP